MTYSKEDIEKLIKYIRINMYSCVFKKLSQNDFNNMINSINTLTNNLEKLQTLYEDAFNYTMLNNTYNDFEEYISPENYIEHIQEIEEKPVEEVFKDSISKKFYLEFYDFLKNIHVQMQNGTINSMSYSNSNKIINEANKIRNTIYSQVLNRFGIYKKETISYYLNREKEDIKEELNPNLNSYTILDEKITNLINEIVNNFAPNQDINTVKSNFLNILLQNEIDISKINGLSEINNSTFNSRLQSLIKKYGKNNTEVITDYDNYIETIKEEIEFNSISEKQKENFLNFLNQNQNYFYINYGKNEKAINFKNLDIFLKYIKYTSAIILILKTDEINYNELPNTYLATNKLFDELKKSNTNPNILNNLIKIYNHEEKYNKKTDLKTEVIKVICKRCTQPNDVKRKIKQN